MVESLIATTVWTTYRELVSKERMGVGMLVFLKRGAK